MCFFQPSWWAGGDLLRAGKRSCGFAVVCVWALVFGLAEVSFALERDHAVSLWCVCVSFFGLSHARAR